MTKLRAPASPNFAKIALACTPTELNLDNSADGSKSSYDVLLQDSAFNPEDVLLAGQAGVAATAVCAGLERQTFADDTVVVAFSGSLDNFDRLSNIYDNSGSPSSNAAQLIRVLFGQMNPRKLANVLKGTFSFVLFDNEQMRAMGVRDGSGVVPLKQGQLDNGTIIISNFDLTTPNLKAPLADVPAGHYIFGWRKLNLSNAITPATEVCAPSVQAANLAASKALAGIVPNRRVSEHFDSVLKNIPEHANNVRLTLSPPPQFAARRSEHIPKPEATVQNKRLSLDEPNGRSDRSSWWRRDQSAVEVLQTPLQTSKASLPQRNTKPSNRNSSPVSIDSHNSQQSEGKKNKRSNRKRTSLDKKRSQKTASVAQNSEKTDIAANVWKKAEIESAVQVLHRIASDMVLQEQEDVRQYKDSSFGDGAVAAV